MTMNDDTSSLEAAHLQRSTLAISQSLMNGKWKHRLCSPSGIGGFPFLWLQQMFHGRETRTPYNKTKLYGCLVVKNLSKTSKVISTSLAALIIPYLIIPLQAVCNLPAINALKVLSYLCRL